MPSATTAAATSPRQTASIASCCALSMTNRAPGQHHVGPLQGNGRAGPGYALPRPVGRHPGAIESHQPKSDAEVRVRYVDEPLPLGRSGNQRPQIDLPAAEGSFRTFVNANPFQADSGVPGSIGDSFYDGSLWTALCIGELRQECICSKPMR